MEQDTAEVGRFVREEAVLRIELRETKPVSRWGRGSVRGDGRTKDKDSDMSPPTVPTVDKEHLNSVLEHVRLAQFWAPSVSDEINTRSAILWTTVVLRIQGDYNMSAT